MNALIEATLDSLLERIENGEGDWIKEWVGGGAPKNYTTNKYYTGINTLLLWSSKQLNQYPTQEWATYKQWQAEGYQVRQGERSTTILLVRDAVKKGGDIANEEDRYRLLKSFSVFNAAQLTAPPASAVVELTEFQKEDRCEATIRATCAKIHLEMQPAYAPGPDVILMPPPHAFADPAAYYCTMFHELTHWTGHKSRLLRGLKYAEEELVAELGAAFLSAQHEIPFTSDNSAAYLRNWLKKVEGDKGRALMSAASAATKAADFIMKFKEVSDVG